MGWRFRKSINLGGGARLNLSKRGAGMSFGGKGFRYSVGPGGRRTTIGIPGTGVSYVRQSGRGRAARRQRAATRGGCCCLTALLALPLLPARWLLQRFTARP